MLAALARGVLISVVVLTTACGGEVSGDGGVQEKGPPRNGRRANGARATSERVLRPGRYRTSLFEPRATFEIGRGWTLSEEASDRMLLLRRPEPRDEAVYLDSSQRELDVDQALRFVREAFVGTTGSPRDFHFSRVTTEDIGDRRGRGMTMSLRADQLVVSLAFATEAYEVRPGDVLRLSAIDVNGRTVLVFVEAPGSRFPGFSKQARVVLSSLDFG